MRSDRVLDHTFYTGAVLDDRIGAELGTTYVALDLETTGLDLENDEIIEVGAVRFNADGGIDSFQTLTNPGRLISRPLVDLTGITDEPVRSPPASGSVAPALEECLAD